MTALRALLSASLLATLLSACGLGLPGLDPGTDPGTGTGGGGGDTPGTGGGSGGCAAGQQLCGASCLDTTQDPLHCGGCDVVCAAGQVCQGSKCQAGGDCRATPCTGLSYCDLGSGQCKPGCINSGQCKAHEVCDLASHACVCDTGYHACSGACVSSTSINTCGTACTPCTPPANAVATCAGLTCSFTCQAGYHRCGNACVSNTSPLTCGTSCSACTPPAGATATCNGTACGFTCGAGTRDCGGGTCAACPAGATSTQCFGAVCVATGTCSDHVKNQGETDVDCGGPCGGCAVGQLCTTPDDCAIPECNQGSDCVAGKCVAILPRPDGTPCVGANTTPSKTSLAGAVRGCGKGACLWENGECVFTGGAPMYNVYQQNSWGMSSIAYSNSCTCATSGTAMNYTTWDQSYGTRNWAMTCDACSKNTPTNNNVFCWSK